MLHNQVVDNRKVLVELSIIPLGSNGKTNDRVAEILNLVNKTGLVIEQLHNGTCIEGNWSDICPLIYACYEQVQEQSPQGYLKVSIR